MLTRLTKGEGKVTEMLTMADEWGRGVWDILTMADKGRRKVWIPPFLADIICEQPLICTLWKYLQNPVFPKP